MARLLLVYASTEGQTEKIAHYIRDRLGAAGHHVAGIRAGEGTPPDAFDAAILAGSLHLGKHQRELVDFASVHRELLAGVPSLFLSVSLSAQGGVDDHANAQKCVDDFIAETGWTPTRTELIAGGVHLKKINPVKRFMIRRILRKKGYEVGPSGDLEFTDWAALDRMVEDFCSGL
ncbi:MAG: flavodoxin domain-containing protein [Alphaproteobacteria bacterium]